MKLRTLLVDDEPLALERLQGFLKKDGDLELIGTATDGLQALEAIRSKKPDLLFLDIQMPELDGFEVLEAVESEEMPLVVFATAFDRYAIRAFETRALDYLLKPFGETRLRETVQRAKEARRAQDAQRNLKHLLEDVGSRRKNRFVVHHEDQYLVIPATEVEAIEAEANYMWIYRRQDAFPLRATLATLEACLDPAIFVRTHRSWILNIQKVQTLLPGTKGGRVAVTSNGLKVPVSGAHRKDLEARLS